jgi:ribA/ribD-fused uncharacterized protein
MTTTEAIRRFTGKYRWLSNFWPCVVRYESRDYPTVEHAYQAAKSLDPIERDYIAGTSTPGEAKRFGRHATLRPDWNFVRTAVMYDLLYQKFSREPLRTKLLATGDADLIEGNSWGDTYWGVDDLRGGENMLGKLLMQIRDELRGEDRR